MKNRKKYLVTAAFSISSITLIVASTITFAAYTTAAEISQDSGYHGKFNQDSIFLNANIWEKDDPTFVMYRFTTGTPTNGGVYVSPSKVITPTINNITYKLHVFEYDFATTDSGDRTCDQFLFFRLDRVVAGNGYSTTASDTYEIYNLTTRTTTPLYIDERNSNHYVARHVAFTQGESYYVREINNTNVKYTNGSDTSYGIDTTGNYTVHFNVEDNENIHLRMTSESFYYNFKWDQTGDINYDQNKNYYCIDSWEDVYNSANSGYHTGHLVLDANENLTWDTSSS